MPNDLKPSNKVAYAGVVIALITFIATCFNFYFDARRVTIADEVAIKQLLDQVWDLLGGHDVTIWISADISRPEEHDDMEKARRILDNEILHREPNHLRGLELKGIYFMKVGQLEDALSQFKQVIAIDAKYHKVYLNRGNVWKIKEEYHLALKDYTTALEINPDFAQAYANRGAIWMLQRELDRAIDDFNKALDLNSRLPHTYTQRGNARTLKGEFDKAMSDFEDALILDPSLASAYCGRAGVWYRKNNYEQTIIEYKEALRVDLTHVRACNNLAWLLATCPDGKYRDGPKAVEFATRAVKLRRNYKNLDTLAASYAENGEFEKAIATEEKAIALLKEKGKYEHLDELLAHLKLYFDNKPLREKL